MGPDDFSSASTFRVFASSARRRAFPHTGALSWSWSLVQRAMPAAYHPHRFCDPASPLAFAPVLRFSAANIVGWCFSLPNRASQRVRSSFRVSTADTSFRTTARSASRELLRPTAHSGLGVHYARALPAQRFRLQGLTTLLTVYSSVTLADHVSDQQRSWAFPFGVFSSRRTPRHSCRADPHAVSSPLQPHPKDMTGSDHTGFWALLPPRVPCSRSGRLDPVTAGGSLGIHPSRGVPPQGLPRLSPRLLLRACRPGRRWPSGPTAPWSIDRPATCLTRRTGPDPS
jgi:hypothetical protein